MTFIAKSHIEWMTYIGSITLSTCNVEYVWWNKSVVNIGKVDKMLLNHYKSHTLNV